MTLSAVGAVMETDFNYFSRRAEEEREAAGSTPHPIARQIHLDMADRYDDLARGIAAHQPERIRAVAATI